MVAMKSRERRSKKFLKPIGTILKVIFEIIKLPFKFLKGVFKLIDAIDFFD